MNNGITVGTMVEIKGRKYTITQIIPAMAHTPTHYIIVGVRGATRLACHNEKYNTFYIVF